MAQRVGLILTGGSLRGVCAEAAALMAFDDLGVSFDAVIGASAGAVVGSLYASGKSGAEVARILASARQIDLLDPDPVALVRAPFRAFRGWTGLLKGKALLAFLRRHLPAHNRIEETARPLHLVVTNVSRGVAQVKGKGPLAEFAVASAAVPFIFQLQEVEGELYADGGILNNIPLDEFIDIYPDFDRYIIATALQVQRPVPEPDNRFLDRTLTPFRILERVARAVTAEQHKENLEAMGREVELLKVPAQELGFDDLARLGPCIEEASVEARRLLQEGVVRL